MKLEKKGDYRILFIGDYFATFHDFRSGFIKYCEKNSYSWLSLTGDCPDGIKRCERYYISRRSLNPVNFIRTLIDLRQKIHQNKTSYGHIIVYMMMPILAVSLLDRLKLLNGFKVIYMFEGLGQNFGTGTIIRLNLIGFILKKLFQFSINNSIVTTQNNADALYLRRILSTTNRVLEMGPIGLDLSKFTPLKKHRKAKRYAFVGRLMKTKGINFYRQFVENCNDIDAKFYICGSFSSGDSSVDETEFMDWVNSDARVEFLGYVNDMSRIYKSIDFLVLPTLYREGAPRTVQEALACGTPVIFHPNIGLNDFMQPEFSILHDFVNEPLTNLWQKLDILTDEQFEKMSQSAIIFARKKLNDELIVDSLLNEVENQN
jgi:glycosyltransferase involved in cell wall biosynthesis